MGIRTKLNRRRLVARLWLMALITLSSLAACGRGEPAARVTLPLTTETPVAATATREPPTPTWTPVTPTDTPPPPTDTPAPTEPATPLPTAGSVTPEPPVEVPLGEPPAVDGTLSSGEWSAAAVVRARGGELLFLHDGTFLYLGIRSTQGNGLGSLCVDRGDAVAVLHSSASLGTALYERSGESWERTRDFAWTGSYGGHLEEEGWVASDARRGTQSEMEFQLAMPGDEMRLVVTYLPESDLDSPIVWPEELADDCRSVRLLQGYAPERMQLAPETWMTVRATTTTDSAGAQANLLAFDSDGGIYVMDVDAALDARSDLRQLLIGDAFGAAWSPDGSQVAYASVPGSGTMSLFVQEVSESLETVTGAPRRLTDGTLEAAGPTWSPDGSQIAFIGKQAGIWDLYVVNANGSNLRQLTADRAIDGHPSWSPDGLQIAFTSERSGNTDVHLLNVAEGGESINLTQSEAVDAAPDWSPDGSQLVFYSSRSGEPVSLFIMDRDGSNITQLTDSPAGDWHPAWSPDGSQIAFVSFRSHQSGDAEIYVMDLAGGPESGGNRPRRLTYSRAHDEQPEWRPLPAAPKPEEISVDTVGRVEQLAALSGHGDRVMDLVFSPDGQTLASSSRDRTLRLWDLPSGQEVHSFRLSRVDWHGIAFSADGRLLGTAEAIWDVGSKQVVHALDRGSDAFGCVDFSPDGSTLAVTLERQPIRLWDLASGEVLRSFQERPDEVVFAIRYSPDGTLLATGAHGGWVRLWDVASGQLIETLQQGSEADDVHDLAFSPDGRRLLAGGTDPTLRLWDVASGETVHTLGPAVAMSVAYSPDGTLVAVGGDYWVQLWDTATGRRVRALRQEDEVMALAFSPDGTLLASGSYDSNIYLWGIPH